MIQDGDEHAPPHAKQESVVTMATISHRWQQQDGGICPLRRWKKGSASENSKKNMAYVFFRDGDGHKKTEPGRRSTAKWA
jgi:hypothetical protein